MTPYVASIIRRLKALYAERQTDCDTHNTLRWKLGSAVVLAVESSDPDLFLIGELERIQDWVRTLPTSPLD